MKSSLKVLFAALVVVVFGMSANAQVTANDKATVTATVVSQLTVTKSADVAFGNIVAGVKPTLAATDGATTGVLGGTKTVGKFKVQGNVGSSVKVSFTSIDLSNQATGTPSVATLKFIPSVTTYATDVQASSTVYASGTDVTLTTDGDFFYVGGTITAANGTDAVPVAAAGDTFSGDFTLTATYN